MHGKVTPSVPEATREECRLGCHDCLRRGCRSWLIERTDDAVSRIRALGLDAPRTRITCAQTAAELCGSVCAGHPDENPDLRRLAERMMYTALTPSAEMLPKA